MADSASLAAELNQEQDRLGAQLEEERPVSAAAHATLERARSVAATALLQGFEAAAEDKVEDKIWNAHLKVNAKLRENLRKLKLGGNAKVVEKRKAAAEYLKFIKSSQKYYRGLIRSLNASYGGIKPLQHVAGELARHDEETRPRSRRQVSQGLEQKVLVSCYRSLVQLGDLSRYRESELTDKDPNWSHAVGFYDLARYLMPGSGVAYNQLAIVALGDGNLFQATYYLYRALSTDEPHPQAEANLRRAFYKISTTKENNDQSNASSAMIGYYLRLVSRCYHGKSNPEHTELENETVSQLRRQINLTGGNNTLRKVFLIAFAGCHIAQRKFTKDPDIEENLQSYFKFYAICIRFSCTLLESFQEKLQRIRETLQAALVKNNTDILRPLEPILPLIRLMMLWAVANKAVLVSSVSTEMSQLQGQFWQVLAKCLHLAAITCDLQTLAEVDYMLEEDEDSIAFGPMLSIDTRRVWYDDSGSLRKRWHNKQRGADRSSAELLARMRYFLEVGMRFSTDEQTPLNYDFSQASILYRPKDSSKKNVPQILSRSDKPLAPTDQPPTPQADSMGEIALTNEGPNTIRRNSDQDEDAERMVTDLVGPSSSIASEPSDPPTRPGSSYHGSSATKTASSYPAGSATVDELLTVAKSFSPRSAPPIPTSCSPSSRPSIIHRPTSSDTGVPEQAQHTLRKSPAADSPTLQGPTLLQRTTAPKHPTIPKSSHGKPPTLTSRTTSEHTRIQSTGSAASWQSVGVSSADGSWNLHHPSYSKENQTPKSILPVTPNTNNATTAVNGAPGTWETDTALTEYGMGSTLLFGAGNSPWSMTGDETKRLRSTGSPGFGSPRLPPSSPALRPDSGTASGVANGPNILSQSRSFSRPAS